MILQKVTVRHGTMLSEKDFLIYLLFLSRSLDIIYLALSEVLLVLSVLTGYKTQYLWPTVENVTTLNFPSLVYGSTCLENSWN